MQCFHNRKVARRTMLVAAAVLGIGAVGGCQQRESGASPESVPKAQPVPIRVVVVDDGPFAAALERQWKARIDNELQLQQSSIADVEAARQLPADIIFYPSACLGTLVEHQLLAVPSAEVLQDEQSALRDVFELQRRVEGRWGDQVYAISFGSPHLVLMYRADLFEQLKLQPPTTWTQYAELLPQLAREQLGAAAPGADQPWSASIEPLGEGWGAKLLLARAAAYASHPSQFSTLFDYETMEPLLTGPPFARALDELVAAAQTSAADATQCTPESARRALMSGQTAMALTWPSRATSDGKPLPLAEGVRVDFAQLPGAPTVYNFSEKVWTPRGEEGTSLHVPLASVAGRLASVGRNARRPREAAGILTLLSGREWSPRICPLSAATTLFRESHLKNPDLWTDEALPREASERYGEVARDSQSQPNNMVCLRIPGWQRYMAALDQAVLEARAGTKTTAAALAGAAESWSAITQELGVATQKSAYMHSLGLEL